MAATVGLVAALVGPVVPATAVEGGFYEWSRATVSSAPSSRYSAVMAFDEARWETVLFGGREAGGVPLNDTWTWDGSQWARRFPAASPAAGGDLAMAYDADRARVVLLRNTTPPETWTWDGAAWTSHTGPAPTNAELSADPLRHQIVAFGRDGASVPKTWTWDGTAWTLRAPPTSPPHRFGHAMAFDASSGEVFVFGGSGLEGQMNDLWGWNGTTWTLRFPSRDVTAQVVPQRLVGASLVASPGGVVLTAGSGNDNNFTSPFSTALTWVWDGRAWRRQANAPQYASNRAAAYDAVRGQVVVFGGVTSCGRPGCAGDPPEIYGFTELFHTGRFPGVSGVAGTPQSMATGYSFAAPLTALVTDGTGHPVAGLPVEFAAPTGGPTASFVGGQSTATVVTGPDGRATSPALNAGAEAGAYVVTASAGPTSPPAQFRLSNSTGPVADVAVVSGSGQNAQVRTVFPVPLTVVATNVAGGPVEGVAVVFKAPSWKPQATFPGELDTATVVTGADGRATAPPLTAGSFPGSFEVTADVGGGVLPASFSLSSVVGPPAVLSKSAGDRQLTVIGTTFPVALNVVVFDLAGNRLPWVPVTYTAPSTKKATATFPGPSSTTTVVANAVGEATAPVLTANSRTGSYVVVATAGAAQTSFELTNVRR